MAGDRDVPVRWRHGRAGLAAGLVDGLRVDLVPVLLGAGVRYVGGSTGAEQLGGPGGRQGNRVTHLHHRVRETAGR